MRWEDESYVKLYSRDTPTWMAMSWQARALLPLLMRKVDKAGLMECGDLGRSAVALMVGLPDEVADAGLQSLERLKVIAWHETVLEIPNYEAAQEAKKGDVLRKRDSRQKARDKARAQALKNTQGESRGVTIGHTASQPVTDGHSPTPSPSSSPSPDLAGKQRPPADPRHAPLVKRLVEAAPGYKFTPRDAKAVTSLLSKGEPTEVETRWRRARARSGYPTVRSVWELDVHWEHFATDAPAGAAGRRPDPTRGMVREQDRAPDAFKKTGTVDDF